MSAALLVIDVQQEALEGCPDPDGLVDRINRLSSDAEEAGVPVIFIQHEGEDELAKGSPGWELADRLDRPDGSHLVPKSYRDGFEETELVPLLEDLGVRRLVITGVHSDYCVQTTALSALIRGYDVTLVKDAHAARGDDPDGIHAFVNSRFATLRYPGRTIEVLPAADVSLGRPASRARPEAPSAT